MSHPDPPHQSHSLTSPRSLRQLTLFGAGASFLLLSTLVTRRAVRRRHLSTIPRFYQPSNLPPPTPINGTLEALEALNIATINVMSFMMMMGGGLLWSFDVSSVEEMRRRVRGVGGEGKVEVEDEEFREWVADVLGRNREKTRDWKEGDGQDRVADARGTGNEREKPR